MFDFINDQPAIALGLFKIVWIIAVTVYSFDHHSLAIDAVLHLLFFDLAKTRWIDHVRKRYSSRAASVLHFSASIYFLIYGGLHMLQECLIHSFTDGHHDGEFDNPSFVSEFTVIWFSLISILRPNNWQKESGYTQLLACHFVTAGILSFMAPVFAATSLAFAVSIYASSQLGASGRILWGGIPESLLFVLNRLESPRLQLAIYSDEVNGEKLNVIATDYGSLATNPSLLALSLHEHIKTELEKIALTARVTVVS